MADFAAPYRRELLAHCYRMLGSVHDAEDAVQETLLRAWQAREGFEGRSSLRVWLYRIATNACLRTVERRVRLPLPSGLGAPGHDQDVPGADAAAEAQWLEPIPAGALAGGGGAGDPATAAAERASIRLAFVSALQLLPARQRAALILREVYAFSAQETAEVLETSVGAVNSALQRARAQIAATAPREDDVLEPSEPDSRRQVERYMHAFEHSDIEGLTRILRDDVVLEMPPNPTWFFGREDVARFLAQRIELEGRHTRMLPIEANGQPGVASYVRATALHGQQPATGAGAPDARGESGEWRAHAIHVLAPTRAGLGRISVFLDPGLFAVFDLPPYLT